VIRTAAELHASGSLRPAGAASGNALRRAPRVPHHDAMRGVTIALLAASLVFVTASGAAAQIGPLIQGRHDVLRAEMYATAIDYGTPDQVLNRLCPRPGHEHGCELVSNALRRRASKRAQFKDRRRD